MLFQHLARTICGPCVNDLPLSSLRHIVSTKKISLAYHPLGYFELDAVRFFEEFPRTLVSGQCANKVVLHLQND